MPVYNIWKGCASIMEDSHSKSIQEWCYIPSVYSPCIWLRTREIGIVISLLGMHAFIKRECLCNPVWVFWTRLLRPFSLWWWVPCPKENKKKTHQQGHPSARWGRCRTVSYKCLHLLCSHWSSHLQLETQKRDPGADILPSHAVACQTWQTNREPCVLAERSGRQRKVKAILL